MVAPLDGSVTRTLTTSDGVGLAAVWWPAEGPSRAVVVLVHGLAATRDHPHIRALARRLRSRGFEVVAYDSRGHGASEGVCTLGDLERLDVAAAVEWARQRQRPVVLVGASMGGIAVLRYAVCDYELAGAVVVSSPAEWRMSLRPRTLLAAGVVRTRPGRWLAARRMGVRIGPTWTSAEPPRSLADRVTCPLAVVHGCRDLLVPASNYLDLPMRAGFRRHVALVRDMGHAYDPVGHDSVCAAVEWTLEQNVASSAAPSA